jgi:hypothetical protein
MRSTKCTTGDNDNSGKWEKCFLKNIIHISIIHHWVAVYATDRFFSLSFKL